MKTKTKILVFALIAALLLAIFSVSAFAAENTANYNTETANIAQGASSNSAEATTDTPEDGRELSDISGTTASEASDNKSTPNREVPLDGNGNSSIGDVLKDGETTQGEAPTASDTDADTILPEENENTAPEDSNDAVNDAATDEPVSGENNVDTTDNPFALIYEAVKRYSSEIMSALAFIGSIILAFAYRKGLMPVIKGALSSFSTLLGKMKESQEAAESDNKAANEALSLRLALAEESVTMLTKNLDAMTLRLAESERDAGQRDALRTVMMAQIDMLYSIFMTANLPQYEKDMVGERIQKMREELQGSEE